MKSLIELRHIEPIVNACPACQSKRIITNFVTGEVFCSECGLVIY